MAPKVTEEHVEARRQQILEAAFACFAREGFHQTTMKDICREAGLSAGAVYGYFRSKEEIIETACTESQQQNMAFIESDMAEGNALEVLDRLADYGFEMLAQPESQRTYGPTSSCIQRLSGTPGYGTLPIGRAWEVGFKPWRPSSGKPKSGMR